MADDDYGTVLGVWAHPDDEAYLSSGLMARAVKAGSRVICVTATRGEGGSLDEEKWPTATLGEVREGELMRCLAMLGVTEHRFLDLPDVDWDTPLPDVGYEVVLDIMREIQPDTVLTFGHEGMTGHEGHKSVCEWTTAAFAKAAPPGAQLLYASVSQSQADTYMPVIEPHGVYRDGAEPPVVPDDAIDVSVWLDDAEIAVKMAALQEHHSQLFGLVQVFGEDLLAEWMRSEEFCRAARRPR
ncbi:MAG TPA: PIG-L deacetylase family protein [Actinomycetes bacterium]|nr:PIG-L deacetylase family protein [Actinomycetes bacterium]